MKLIPDAGGGGNCGPMMARLQRSDCNIILLELIIMNNNDEDTEMLN